MPVSPHARALASRGIVVLSLLARACRRVAILPSRAASHVAIALQEQPTAHAPRPFARARRGVELPYSAVLPRLSVSQRVTACRHGALCPAFTSIVLRGFEPLPSRFRFRFPADVAGGESHGKRSISAIRWSQ
ncbi:hypothetical protein AXF42_Ash014003 [Apostasia shenzhenica]|uniref:Uncharacterized protein n=1 Tax=Apostasia shenzhenica TaxID=1088818 RepID=A0A2I0A946_9ASPA|nr:hypothetical protein AXF42_Ash014003 [Apostasia shenzhenica]